MAKEAILVMDMLEDFLRPGAPLEVPKARKILPALKRRIAQARRRKIPVVYVCDSHTRKDPELAMKIWPPHAMKGTAGSRVVLELAPRRGDFIVRKNTYSAFYKTRLDRLLRRLGVRQVTLTGCVTNICVLYTAHEALQRGYRVAVPRDSVAGLDPADHRFALRQIKTVIKGKVF